MKGEVKNMIIGFNSITKAQNTACPDCKAVQNPISKSLSHQVGDTVQLSFKGTTKETDKTFDFLPTTELSKEQKSAVIAYSKNKSPEAQEKTAESLWKISDPKTHEAVIRNIYGSKSKLVKLQVIDELSRMQKNSKVCPKVCEKYLKDKDVVLALAKKSDSIPVDSARDNVIKTCAESDNIDLNYWAVMNVDKISDRRTQQRVSEDLYDKPGLYEVFEKKRTAED